MHFNKSIVGSSIAFIVATACCWLPALIIAIGGGSTLFGINKGLEKSSGIFMVIGVGMLAYGIYQYWSKRNTVKEAVLQSTITCPECAFEKEELMLTNACQFFYECQNCSKILRPKGEDCCVFCSYGTVACPPIQLDQDCC